MSDYECGYNSEPAFMTNDPLGFIKYFTWRDTVGYKGDNSMCWKCYCKKRKEDKR